MDEASVAFHLTGLVGTVLRTGRFRRARCGDRASLGARRGFVTYIASICNDPEVNRILPQVVLGNTHRFLLKTLREVQPELGENIYLWREKTSWNNKDLMKRWIRLLCMCLGPWLDDRAVYLVVDMATCHIHPSVQALAMEKGIRMILVPAGMTGLLQPLDTHVFKQFRDRMQQLWIECKSNASDGQVNLRAWLLLVCKALQAVVVEKSWAHAFERVGILSAQKFLSPKILKALNWESLPKVPDSLPALGQASALFPRRSRANVAAWVHWTWDVEFTRIQTLDWWFEGKWKKDWGGHNWRT